MTLQQESGRSKYIKEMLMSMTSNNTRIRSAQARDFGMGGARLRDMRWHFQVSRGWFTT